MDSPSSVTFSFTMEGTGEGGDRGRRHLGVSYLVGCMQAWYV